MLHAVIHRKRRSYLEKPWEYEDYITSSFFGAIQYLKPSSACKIISAMFNVNISSDSKLDFEFWPNIGSIPELLITIDKTFCLHIEVKWNAGQSPSAKSETHQVFRQREDIKKMGYSKIHSIYLVKNISKAQNEFSSDQKKEVNITSWSQVGNQLRGLDLEYEDKMASQWKDDAVKYLKEMGVNIFGGFSTLKKLKHPDIEADGILFFSGINGFVFPVGKCRICPNNTVFYQQGE